MSDAAYHRRIALLERELAAVKRRLSRIGSFAAGGGVVDWANITNRPFRIWESGTTEITVQGGRIAYATSGLIPDKGVIADTEFDITDYFGETGSGSLYVYMDYTSGVSAGYYDLEWSNYLPAIVGSTSPFTQPPDPTGDRAYPFRYQQMGEVTVGDGAVTGISEVNAWFQMFAPAQIMVHGADADANNYAKWAGDGSYSWDTPA